MSTTTKNFNLIKPELTDAADITATNQNWDTIDQALKECAVIPVTNDVPEDTNIWIDPDDTSIEEEHINNTNNPHNVTSEQVGAISRTLIWENQNPSITFVGRNINLPLSDYDGVEIICCSDNNNLSDYVFSGFIPIIKLNKVGVNITQVHSHGVLYCRGVNIYKSENYVNLGTATKGNISGTDGGVDNNVLIPVYIYGIKGVR